MKCLSPITCTNMIAGFLSISRGESPPISKPAGVSTVDVTENSYTVLSNPFDGAKAPWIAGVSASFVWDAVTQHWIEVDPTVDGSLVNKEGDHLARKSGTSVVVGGPGANAGLVVMSGVVPVESDRIVPLEEGLTLQGNPFGALTGDPLKAEWYQSELEGSSNLRFVNPAKAVFAPRTGLPEIEPMGLAGKDVMSFRVTPGAYLNTPLVVLTRENQNGAPGGLSEGWMQRAVVAAPAEGIDLTLPLPQGGGAEGTLLLVVVSPQIDTDRDGVPDGIESLVLGSDWQSVPGDVSGDETAEADLSADAREARRQAQELQMIQMAGRTIHAPPPAFSVNDAQERTVGEHDRKGKALRRLGLKSVSDLTAFQAVTLETEAKAGRNP